MHLVCVRSLYAGMQGSISTTAPRRAKRANSSKRFRDEDEGYDEAYAEVPPIVKLFGISDCKLQLLQLLQLYFRLSCACIGCCASIHLLRILASAAVSMHSGW